MVDHKIAESDADELSSSWQSLTDWWNSWSFSDFSLVGRPEWMIDAHYAHRSHSE
jgi:hypothetical protein